MVYRVPVRESGVRAALGSVVRRRYREVRAVDRVSLEVDFGEVVGFIGPNGAGKTTTLKVLSGILHPTAGRVEVAAHQPWRRRPVFLKQIALIRGNQPLVAVEQTVLDLLRYQQLLYEVPEGEFRPTVSRLTAMLGLEPLLARQARALSLGERMKVSLALALAYRPRILFLDEPTIGLDASAALEMRGFLAEYAAVGEATILLTSHYMADVESLCPRVVLIDRGSIAHDGDLEALSARISPYKLLRLQLADGARGDWERFGEVTSLREGRLELRVARERAPEVTAQLLATVPVLDLAVENPPLESVIDRVYREGLS